MLAAVTPTSTHEVPPHQEMLPAEADFYADYDWCLDPHLTIGEATDRLRGEIGRLDVAPDGTAFNLMSPGLDVVRASYRDMSRGRQWLQSGRVYQILLPNLITSNVFLKGHRIRVQVFGSFAPNFARNLQTGKSETTSAKMKKARIRIYEGGGQQSEIVVPVVK